MTLRLPQLLRGGVGGEVADISLSNSAYPHSWCSSNWYGQWKWSVLHQSNSLQQKGLNNLDNLHNLNNIHNRHNLNNLNNRHYLNNNHILNNHHNVKLVENGEEAKWGASKQALGEICNGKISTTNDKNQIYEFMDYGSFNTKAPFPDLTNAMLLLHSIYNLQPYTSDQKQFELLLSISISIKMWNIIFNSLLNKNLIFDLLRCAKHWQRVYTSSCLWNEG